MHDEQSVVRYNTLNRLFRLGNSPQPDTAMAYEILEEARRGLDSVVPVRGTVTVDSAAADVRTLTGVLRSLAAAARKMGVDIPALMEAESLSVQTGDTDMFTAAIKRQLTAFNPALGESRDPAG